MSKADCKPYRVEKNSKYGRFLVTSRDVRQGEVLLRESPVVVGPRVDSLPGCRECFAPLFSAGPRCRCRECGVPPLCPSCCHNPLECRFFSNLSRAQKELCLRATNQYILPLRVLLYLRSVERELQERYSSVLDMEAHQEARRGSDVWYSHQESVVELLRTCGVISAAEEDTELVQRICGVLDVNSFEVRGPGGPLRGVYSEAALMSHNCLPNVHLSVDDNFLLTVRASVDIPQGGPILNNYTDPLQTTSERQKHLREGKYFACECSRCEDPTELGTYLSALWCPRCRIGRVLACPASMVWACDNCNHRYSPRLIASTNAVARELVDSLDRSDIGQLEEAVGRLSSSFVPSHSLLLDLKQSIVAVYREQAPTMPTLIRKVELCRELLTVLRVIQPGISRLIGITLYELHIALVSLAQEQGKGSGLQELMEAEEVLKEAVKMLLYEPPASPEGQLARQAMHKLKTLKQIIGKQQLRDRKDKKVKNKK